MKLYEIETDVLVPLRTLKNRARLADRLKEVSSHIYKIGKTLKIGESVIVKSYLEAEELKLLLKFFGKIPAVQQLDHSYNEDDRVRVWSVDPLVHQKQVREVRL